ncbi:MAG: HDOD domain-containing protein [Gammaproteobacteria bacterium]|nr:MAG: HDOD domain-containing protein [Gammaproteobacteria bacterium]
MTGSNTLSIPVYERMKRFATLARLSDEQRVVLSARAEFRRYPRGTLILRRGSRDAFDYFLWEGSLRLRAQDGREVQVTPESRAAAQAIAHLQPRQYDVIADAETVLLLVDQATLAQMIREAPRDDYDMVSDTSGEDPAYELLAELQEALKHNTLRLPSLPDLAFQIRQAADQSDCSVESLAQLIMRDPAMTAKLIRVANSPLFRGFREIESCKDALVRLGLDATRQLVTIYSLRELFESSHPELRQRMQDLWLHSVEVASIAGVLARMTPGLSRERAILAGIIHDIGAIPLLMYAESHQDVADNPELLDRLLGETKAEIGVAVLERWGFAGDLIEVVAHGEDWSWESGQDSPTYADAIIIAQLHHAIGHPQPGMPPMDSVPAFRKLALGELTPQRSLQVLQMAEEEIQAIRQSLKL